MLYLKIKFNKIILFELVLVVLLIPHQTNAKSITIQQSRQLQPTINNYQIALSEISSDASAFNFPKKGLGKLLVLRVRYDDLSFDTELDQNYWENIFNGSSTSTLEGFFSKSSYGQLTIQSTIYPTTYAIGRRSKETENRPAYVFSDTLDIADNDIDFSQYDGVAIIHAGLGNGNLNDGDIWTLASCNQDKLYDNKQICGMIIPEKYGNDNDLLKKMGFGIIAHEFGHLLGLQDLYQPTLGANVSSYDLMAYGSSADNGQNPTDLTAWNKIQLGWITPTEIKNSGQIQINNLSDNKNNSVYKISGYNSTQNLEYFLIENRQDLGLSIENKNRGLVIWHIYEQNIGVVPFIFKEEVFASNLNFTRFAFDTTPNSNTHAGLATGIGINNISVSGQLMTANVILSAPTIMISNIEKWQKNKGGESLQINWQTTNNDSSNVKLEYQINEEFVDEDTKLIYIENNWLNSKTNTIVNNLNSNTNTYTWTLPNEEPFTTLTNDWFVGRIKITLTDDIGYVAYVSPEFKIIPQSHNLKINELYVATSTAETTDNLAIGIMYSNCGSYDETNIPIGIYYDKVWYSTTTILNTLSSTNQRWNCSTLKEKIINLDVYNIGTHIVEVIIGDQSKEFSFLRQDNWSIININQNSNPDIGVTNIIIDSENISKNQSAKITVTTENFSDIDENNILLTSYINGKIHELRYIDLNAQNTNEQVYFWTPTKNGQYIFEFKLAQLQNETNYANNTLSKTINVSSSSIFYDLELLKLSTSSQNIKTNKKVTIVSKIINNGNKTAQNVKIQYFVNGALKKTFNLGSLKSNQTKTKKITWKTKKAGTYEITTYVIFSGQDNNYDNNSKTTQIIVTKNKSARINDDALEPEETIIEL